jgi:O-antigen/teichoic acid export membrane protein
MTLWDSRSLKHAVNVALRFASLVAKLGLALYMGRYFGLEDMGVYGLVFGAVMILSGALGLRLDYIVARDLVGSTPADTLGIMRDQTVFLLLNHFLLALAMLAFSLMAYAGMEAKILIFIFALSVVENFASAIHVNMTSLGRPVLANLLFFVRAASWVFPVVVLGILDPAYRTVNVVLEWWIFGVLGSLGLALWFLRHLPWPNVWHHPIRWEWIKAGVRKSSLIWLGTIGLAAGMYVDRFVVMEFLGLDYVGIATFYFSFTTALLTLVDSGVLAFAYPRLIKLHRQGDRRAFRHEAGKAGLHTALFATVLVVGIGIGVPLIGYIFHRPEFVRETKTLWLMLAGTWLRANAESLYYVLFARGQDKAIWLGNLLFLIPAFGFNIVLVPYLGLPGIGYGMVVSSTFLLLWRTWHVFTPKKRPHASTI